MMTDIELLVIFCFFFIGKEKDINTFTAKFNKYFKKDYSPQTIRYEVTKFKNANPANNMAVAGKNIRQRRIWEDYVLTGRDNELKILYSSFKNGVYIENSIERHDYYDRVLNYIDRMQAVRDEPRKLEAGYMDKENMGYKRNQQVVANALSSADYVCEGECDNILFKRKDGKTYYTEGHHLIPLSYQMNFEYSLDVEANVVSLCPICHRLLHYGYETGKLLENLYVKRKERLRKCNIYVSYEELMLMYR